MPVCMATVQGTFTLKADGNSMTNGDIVNSQLALWPWEEKRDISFLREYVGKPLLEHFYVVEIVNGNLKNGTLYVDFKVAIKKSFNGQSKVFFPLDEGDTEVAIKSEGFVFGKKNTEKFILSEQPDKKGQTYHYVWIIFLTGVISIASWQGFGYYKKRRQRIEREKMIREEREKLISLMKNMANKEDIQKLYAKKDQMKGLFASSRQFEQVLIMMDEHQYKNHVPEQVISDIRNKIRNGI